MKVVIASKSPVKIEASKRGFLAMFPHTDFIFECVSANSGISDQPMSGEEIRNGSIGRVTHARELLPEADFYIGLEGGVENLYGELHNTGWVTVESKNNKRGHGRTLSFALPSEIRRLIIDEGMEQSHATDKVLNKESTKMGTTGTLGPLSNNALNYSDWYTHAVIGALVPFLNEDLY